jgi:predicted glycogen debranching enzyme
VTELAAEPPLRLRVEAGILHDPEQALAREWLVTNGLGGYASGSLLGANTRRYHGLLVAALQPPARRMVLLAGLVEEVALPAGTRALSTYEFWDGTLHPEGWRALETVDWEGTVPVFRFNLQGVRLERRIWMEQARNTTVITYHLPVGAPSVELALAPLCTARDFHQHTHGDASWRPVLLRLADGLQVQMREGLPALRLRGFPRPQAEATGEWWWRFLHRAERERGLDEEEDLYRAGRLWFHLEPGATVTLLATAEWEEPSGWRPDASAAALRGREAALRARVRALGAGRSELRQRLALAADQFLVARPPRGTTVIAGYPWFGDWGRDTMISLPGLCLATGREDLARLVLQTFARYVDGGMIPNRFPDDGSAPEYGAVDATWWWVLAIDAYEVATQDQSLVEELLPVLIEAVRCHLAGTRHGIHVDDDGLLAATASGMALTWMDARVGERAVTPRTGKPVEVNALWYNALRLVAGWWRRSHRDASRLERLADRVLASFARRFWYEAGGYCYDVVDGPQGEDASLRPNQVIGLGLRHALLAEEQASQVLAAVRAHLLTPVGLRTLSPEDPRYIGSYRGDQQARDAAYHQGTVWPWLLGPYWEAHLKLGGDVEAVQASLRTIELRLLDAGVGTLGEIFEGDPPYRAVGCIAQAWSVGEVLRLVARGAGAGRHR